MPWKMLVGIGLMLLVLCIETLAASQAPNSRLGILKNGTLFVKEGDLSAAWVTEEEGVSSFQLAADRIGILKNGALLVKEGGLSARWVSEEVHVTSFQLEGDRIGILKNGTLFVKEGDLSASWVSEEVAVTNFQLEGDRIGILKNGTLFVKEGNLSAPWVTEEHAVSNFQLEGERIGILKNGTLLVKEGELSASWVTEDVGAVSFQLEADRIGVLRNAGSLYVKEGNLTAPWVIEEHAVKSFHLAGDRIGILKNGTLFVKEGGLSAPWIAEDVGDKSFQLQADRIGVLRTAGTLLVKEGNLAAPWITEEQAVGSYWLQRTPALIGFPRYNEVYGVATHNSYWINRSDQLDYFASGTQELLTDQLLHDHVRAIELDVHSEGAPPGRWKIYHTSDSEDFSCRYLEDCLEDLRLFHYSPPQHDVINIIVELKNVVSRTGVYDVTTPVHNNFSSDHTIEQFDDSFRRVLGPWLYTPKEFLERCPGSKSMRECAASHGWPTIDKLRGKFIVNVIGNWSTAGYDWVSYATSNLRNRVAFPMQSVAEVQPSTKVPFSLNLGEWFQVTEGGGSFWIKDVDGTFAIPEIDPTARQVAFDSSVFWQFEKLDCLNCDFALGVADAFRNAGGVIRPRDSFEYWDGPDACIYDNRDDRRGPQLDRLQKGFQFIQTDYPWHIVHDEGPPGEDIPTDPSRRLRDDAWVTGKIGRWQDWSRRELGAKLYFHTLPNTEMLAYQVVSDVSQRWWETTVSTTRLGDTLTTRTHHGLARIFHR